MSGMREYDKTGKTILGVLQEDGTVSNDKSSLHIPIPGEGPKQERSPLDDSQRILNVGFTGTRRGMTPEQERRVENLLNTLIDVTFINKPELWAHHGDCVGSDEQFHFLAIEAGFNVHIHPPDNPKLRAYCHQKWLSSPTTRYSIVTLDDPKPYKIRNGDIVRASDLMIATPHKNEDEQLYSGTWATVRIARLRNVPYVIYYSDGRREGGNRWKRLLR